MKYLFQLSILLFLLLSLTQCENNKAKIEEEKAKAARAEADSLKKVMEDLLKEEEKELGNNLPDSSVREKGKLNPVDEGQNNADFAKFRKKLMEALDRKDVGYLVGVLSPEIKVGFGGGTGIADFKKAWQLDSAPKNSRVWQELKNVLELGGTFDNKDESVFTAPYIFTSFPDEFDAFESGAITGQGVRVRNSASRNGKQIGQLSYDIVKILPPKGEYKTETIGKETHNWVNIQMPDGRTGYVYGKYVRMQIDYRASFEKTKEGWKMFFLVVGD